ncbi:SPOR domain-containing protein [Hymenobacter coalescens]
MVHPHTVVGAFSTVEAAQRAADQLTQNGFAPDCVEVSDHDTTTTENPTGEFPENDGFHHLIMAIFGPPANSSAPRYDARRHGFVAAHVDTYLEAERARDLLDHAGAVDVHEIGIGHRGALADTPQDAALRPQRSRILERRPGQPPRPL